jgi:hypothetical protein
MYLAQEYLDAKSSNSAKRAKDAALLPGRRLLLVHALQLLQQHPNMEFRGHPAYVLTQVGCRHWTCAAQFARPWLYNSGLCRAVCCGSKAS